MLAKQTFLQTLVTALLCLLLLAAALPLEEAAAPADAVAFPMQPDSAQPAAAEQSAVTYTYDALGRLVRVDYGDGASIAYTYDAGGNLLNRSATVGSRLLLPLIHR